jgi:hypothetical protein
LNEDKTPGASKDNLSDTASASEWNGLENEDSKAGENTGSDFRDSPQPLSPPLEASIDSKDRSGIPYEIKKKTIGASDWKGIQIEPPFEDLSKDLKMDALMGESDHALKNNDALLIDPDRKYLGKGFEESEAEDDVESVSYKLKKRAHSASGWTGLGSTADAATLRSEKERLRLVRKVTLIQQEKMDLPEITFFQSLRVFDPLAFYMEILLNNGDAEFKKRYLKMCLLKVYGAKLFVAGADGAWEESAPESLLAFGAKDFKGPTWINEGREELENHFVMPIIFDDKFTGAMGLVITGQISHEKMKEMEFWCYLGRCTCN